MLGKLIKHDFKATGKVMIPLNMVLVIVTILGSLLVGSRLLQRTELLPLTITLVIAYALMMIALSTVASIFLIVNFYRNMFSSQGYLTFTLPASPWSLLHSKTIVGFVWVLINTLLTFASVFLLTGSAAGFSNLGAIFREMADASVTADGVTVSIGLTDIIGYTLPQLALLLVLLTLISGFYSVAMGYGSVAIGQLYAKHKVVGTVIAYLVLQFISQIVMSVVMLFVSLRPLIGMVDSASQDISTEELAHVMRSIYQPMLPILIVVFLVIGVGCYVAAGIIMNKKVNLD